MEYMIVLCNADANIVEFLNEGVTYDDYDNVYIDAISVCENLLEDENSELHDGHFVAIVELVICSTSIIKKTINIDFEKVDVD